MTLGWVFEGKILNRAKTMLQVNLHSYEDPKTMTGAVIELDYELHRVRVTFHGPRCLVVAHRCIADVLEAIDERSDEAHPEAFDVRSTEFIHLAVGGKSHKSVEIRMDGRVNDALAALASHFGTALMHAFTLGELERARRNPPEVAP